MASKKLTLEPGQRETDVTVASTTPRPGTIEVVVDTARVPTAQAAANLLRVIASRLEMSPPLIDPWSAGQ